jgi:DNA-binding IclR family transcriptional regulator
MFRDVHHSSSTSADRQKVAKDMPRSPATRSRATPSPGGKLQEDRHFVTALARGLEVLACFGSGDTTLSNQDIAQRCKLPKSTVSRLTLTLTRLGYLIRTPHGRRYRLGVACVALGSAMLSRLDVRRLARPMMQELAVFARGTVSLAVHDRLSMIFIAHARGEQSLAYSGEVGTRLPLVTSAIGRAWLAASSEPDREGALSQLRVQEPANWPSAQKSVSQAAHDYARLGVACSFEEWQPHVNSIARAVLPSSGLPLMAMSVGGPSFSLTQDFLLNEVRPRLIALVRGLEAQLGT